jgi:aspartokinase-like uncharacterized kinase
VGLIVVKVGGSLFDLPDLGRRLALWLPPSRDVLLVPGGGPTADAIRRLDSVHRLGQERSHWLALGALALNARFLAGLLPGAAVVEDPCLQEGTAVLDALAFARADEGWPGRLPHTWDVTSDSIAARAAVVARAGELVLLKSAALPAGVDWVEAARLGLVDPHFAATAAPLGGPVRVVDFRAAHRPAT